SFLLFPVRQLQDKLAASYASLGDFLFAKSNLFDVDMGRICTFMNILCDKIIM
ncbi:FUSC family membrane protein, partial [Acinetobacter baumannii]|uniref:FUSC family membrane protein n=1 Tax=Acinetobacter baumannii TaxID=470 RepID=UPI001BB3D281